MKFFVIAPQKSDNLFEDKKQIVAKVAQKVGFKASYGVDLFNSEQNNVRAISLYSSFDFFIADLSFERPSCYFEVGFAQALNKQVHIIAQKDTIIFQVLNRDNILFYDNLLEYEKSISLILFHPFEQTR